MKNLLSDKICSNCDFRYNGNLNINCLNEIPITCNSWMPMTKQSEYMKQVNDVTKMTIKEQLEINGK